MGVHGRLLDVIPPQADVDWLGEAGPGPSYLDPGSGGPENDFTNRNTTFMTWNLMHMARMIKDAGGIPAHGNQRSAWDAGCRSDFPNPTTNRPDRSRDSYTYGKLTRLGAFLLPPAQGAGSLAVECPFRRSVPDS